MDTVDTPLPLNLRLMLDSLMNVGQKREKNHLDCNGYGDRFDQYPIIYSVRLTVCGHLCCTTKTIHKSDSTNSTD